MYIEDKDKPDNSLAINDDGSINVGSISASTVNIGHVVAHEDLLTAYAGTATSTIYTAAIAVTSTGDNTVVTGVASKKIYVLSGVVIVGAQTNLKWWTTSTAGTALSGVMCCAASGGYAIPYNPRGALITSATGEHLVLNMSAASTVGGFITYVVV